MQKINVFDLMRKVDAQPTNAGKYLMWDRLIVADIGEDNSLMFRKVEDDLARLMVDLTFGQNASYVSSESFKAFLADRLPSRVRPDISSILKRCGLVEYDEFRIARVTRAVNAMDLFWVAKTEEERMDLLVEQILKKIFLDSRELNGGSVVSPEGVNTKRYGVYYGDFGVFKRRLHSGSTDVESEVAVHMLSRLMGIKTCEAAIYQGRDSKGHIEAFSKFEYDFLSEYIVHASRLITQEEAHEDQYGALITSLPQLKDSIDKMIILDFVTRQTDRHLSNIALKVDAISAEFYHLYDNGRSLFFEDEEPMMQMAVEDLEGFSDSFGGIGTYWDVVQRISEERDISQLVNLNISKGQIADCLSALGVNPTRKYYAVEWVERALEILRKL